MVTKALNKILYDTNKQRQNVRDSSTNGNDDPDQGGYHYDDHRARAGDSEEDGLPDPVDASRYNERDHDNDGLGDDCDHDGYNDEDRVDDGFHDDDHGSCRGGADSARPQRVRAE